MCAFGVWRVILRGGHELGFVSEQLLALCPPDRWETSVAGMRASRGVSAGEQAPLGGASTLSPRFLGLATWFRF